MALLLGGLDHLVHRVANHRLHYGAVALEVGVGSILAPLLGKTSLVVCQGGVVVQEVVTSLLGVCLLHLIEVADELCRLNLLAPAEHRGGSDRAEDNLNAISLRQLAH